MRAALNGDLFAPQSSRLLRLQVISLALSCLIGLAMLAHPSPARAATPTATAVAMCKSCSSVQDLQNAATAFFQSQGANAPNSAIVYIVSLNEPISMYFVKDYPNG